MTEPRRDRAYFTTDEIDTLGELTDMELDESSTSSRVAGVTD